MSGWRLGLGCCLVQNRLLLHMILLIPTNFLSLDKTFLLLRNHPLRDRDICVKYI